ncbi:MAG: SDR family NAD(P)-dependent oxidoreductase [Acetobacteraceae bacterium]|nr:SDR family NAD(P)-dependent oxidoreductase [Acetobacteraceae bacterium]
MPRRQQLPKAATPKPIAIIGAAARLPGAPDLASFAALLRQGVDAVTEVPNDRFEKARWYHPRPGAAGRSYSFAAGTIGDIKGFDTEAFGLSPREIAEADPQQRLLLEVTRDAFEDAGLRPEALAGRNIAVFIGGSSTDFGELRLDDPAAGDRFHMTGNALSILSNRIGHVFDLRGGAQTIDTACSSSLVALHLAAKALADDPALEAAVVGGVNLLLSPYAFMGFSRAGMLSPRGRCQVFDAAADGYVRAEGAGVVILRRLADAKAAQEPIRAVLLGTGGNTAGRTIGISLPNRDAQATLLRSVLERSGVHPDRFLAFEAHGTGTQAGDPAEAWAIGQAIARQRSQPLPVGSAKANIGHLEAGAGMAGLLKSVLMLEQGFVPRALHFENPNPAIDFTELNLAVPRATESIVVADDAVIGVNAFGFGGTNAAAILGRAAPTPAPRRPVVRGIPPLILSARSAEALRLSVSAWRNALAGADDARAAALLRGQARYRDLAPHRLVLRGADGAALTDGLAAWQAGQGELGIAQGVAAIGRVAFVFSGNGAQHAGMAREAFRASAAFRRAVLAADAVLAPRLGLSPAALIKAGVSEAELAGTDLAQPLLFAVQMGVLAALKAEGINPDLVIGHSVGEVAAAQAAGMLSLDQAAALIVARSRHQHTTKGTGRMAAIGATPETMTPMLEECGPGLEIAAINAPAALTIAGPAAAIVRLCQAAEAARLVAIPLDLDYAFHSTAMDPVREGLLQDLALLSPKSRTCPMISSVTGKALYGPEAGAEYWWRNLREPVRFQAAVAEAARQGARLFLEIGPAPVLQNYLRETLRATTVEGAILSSLKRQDAQGDPFPAIADRAIAAGADPRAARSFQGAAERTALPHTPFARRSIWFPRSVESARLTVPELDHPLLGFRQGIAPGQWTQWLDTTATRWLGDHKLFGEAVMPAAAMVESALAAAALMHPEAPVLEVSDLAILRAVTLTKESEIELRYAADTEGGFTLRSRPRLAEEELTLCARARLAALPRLPSPPSCALTDGTQIAGAEVIAFAARHGLNYGPAFQTLQSVVRDHGTMTALARLDLPETAPDHAGFILHPALLDGAFQGLFSLLLNQAFSTDEAIIPVRIGRLCARRDAPPIALAEITAGRRGARLFAASLTLRDGAGAIIATIEDIWFQRAPRPGREKLENLAFRLDPSPSLPPNGAAAELRLAPIIAAIRAEDQTAPLTEAGLLLEAHLASLALPALRENAASRGPYRAALWRILALAGVAEPEAGGWRIVEDQPLPPPEAIWRAVLAEQPGLALDLAWLARAGEQFESALQGEAITTAPPPALGGAMRALAEPLLAGLRILAQSWPKHRPLRVLELGAGGALTRGALAILGSSGLSITYKAIGNAQAGISGDVSDAITLHWADWDSLKTTPNPTDRADVIIGLAPAALGGRGGEILEGLITHSAPGAALLLAEPAPGAIWNFTLGQDPSWWRDDLEGALPDAVTWRKALSLAGWQGTEVTALEAAPWPALLLSGESPTVKSPDTNRVLAGPSVVFADAEALPLAEALVARLSPDERPDILPLDESLPPKTLRAADILVLTGMAESATALAHLVKLAANAEGVARRIMLVAKAEEAAAAALVGLGRVLANEMPGLNLRRVTLAPSMMPEAAADRLLTERVGNAPEVVLSPEGRFVPLLRPGLPALAPAFPGRLAIEQPGQLASLTWQPIPVLPKPGPGEVRLRITATGLNFRDVMWAQGLLPEDILMDGFAGPSLGMECAGVVEEVGTGVAFEPGTKVFGFAPAAFATHALTRVEALQPLPSGLSPEAAATIPVAFITAAYSLETLARLRPGERVLIHGGAGGVGLAALQIAKAAGAFVAASAGTPEKRAFLRQLGADLVLDSRDAGFADALRAAWPDGVDVVLNSLAGVAMERSLALLAPFGRFIELGKRDFAEGRRTGLGAFRRNISYFAVDADALPRARPALAEALLRDIAARLGDGTLLPLPYRAFPAEEAEAAFRQLQASSHIGKLVISPPLESRSRHAQWEPDEAGCYVVLGGTQGFGLECAKWLAAAGARRIALISRRGAATPGIDAALRILAALGARASAHSCDATDRVALGAVLTALRAEGTPIRGVVQAAAIFADGAAARQDQASFARVFAPKLLAAEALEALTENDPLHLFLLFSSATTAFGNPGQANYVAANAALEGLARRRHTEGKPALAVGWGPIADAGVLTREAAAAEKLERLSGAKPMAAQEALAALPALIGAGAPVIYLARMNWAGMQAALPILAEPAFAALASQMTARDADGAALRARLLAMAPEAARAEVLALAREEMARILRLPPEAVRLDQPLPALGLDSLGGIELRMALERRLGVSVPLTAVTEDLTLEILVQRVAGVLFKEDSDIATAEALMQTHEPAVAHE